MVMTPNASNSRIRRGRRGPLNIGKRGAAGVAPVNTVAPAVTRSGNVLTTTNGTWTGTPSPTFASQWQRSADGVTGWTNISGQTGASYELMPPDEGQYFRSVITASNSVGPVTATSNVVGPFDAETIWSWQPFNVTTGDSGDWIGYSNGDIISPPFNPPSGSISGEPTSIAELEALFQDPSGEIVAVFHGDWQLALQNLGVTINGQTLLPDGYSLQGGNTFLHFTPYSGALADATAYPVTFAFMEASALNREGLDVNRDGPAMMRLE